MEEEEELEEEEDADEPDADEPDADELLLSPPIPTAPSRTTPTTTGTQLQQQMTKTAIKPLLKVPEPCFGCRLGIFSR